MRAAVIVFPGSNCDRDLAVALERASGRAPEMVWHKDTALPAGLDLVCLPGGFSFGDYLRCGAIAARAPIMAAVRAYAARGGLVFGVCNGWQILIEAGLLGGALLRNHGLAFVSHDVRLRVEARSAFTGRLAVGATLRMPIAHHDGAFFAEPEALARLEGEGLVAFRYVDADGRATAEANPNGSASNIAGAYAPGRRVLGMMPHPERLADRALGGDDGAAIFASVVDAAALAA